MKRTFPSVFLLLAIVIAAPAQAQTTVLNPRTVEFDPSADHSSFTAANEPVVQRYDLQIYMMGASQPMTTADLGKPAPAADGKIRVDFSSLVAGWPLADGSYQARVAAIGPTGNAASDPSNTFAFQSCGVTLASASQSVAAGGASFSVKVTAATACSWAVTNDAAWVMAGTLAGSGEMTLGFTVAANIGTTPRMATLVIGGQTFTITQAAAPIGCSYSLSPPAETSSEAGGPGTVTVNTSSSCSWTATGATSWITLSTGGGMGTGVVSFTVAANPEPLARMATLTIAGRAFSVTQAAGACTYALSPSSQSFGQVGGTGSVSVTCGASCTWTASPDGSWVTVTRSSGKGAGTLTYSVAKNLDPTARTATVTVAGKVHTVNQAAAKRPTAPKKVRLTTIIGG